MIRHYSVIHMEENLQPTYALGITDAQEAAILAVMTARRDSTNLMQQVKPISQYHVVL